MGNNHSRAAATFVLNKAEPIHRWYPYLEGYSSRLVEDIVMEIGPENIHTILDPFGGSGTTPLVASSHGIKSLYCETNPFMQQVIEAKINSVKRLRDSRTGSRYLKEFLKELESIPDQLTSIALRLNPSSLNCCALRCGFKGVFTKNFLQALHSS